MKYLLIPLLFLVGCGKQIPIKQEQPQQSEIQKRMAISQEQNLGVTQTTETIEVQVKPQEVIPAVTEKLTKKEVRQRIDNAKIELDFLNDKIDRLTLEKEQKKTELEQAKLLLTQFK